jgi:hypothetical protein
MIFSCKRNTEFYIIPVGQRIHHDDFEYSVANYMVTNFLRAGTDTLHAKGMFYLVNFKVENRALRVSHEWSNNIAYIIDGAGGKYENVPSVQQFFLKSHKFNYQESYSTPAGSSDSTFLAFDIPLTVIRPCLMVKGSTLMGDIFDNGKFRRMMIKLF